MSPADLSKLKDMVAEHLDNLYYLNDILCLKVHAINEVLTAQVIKKLLVPLYLHSLIPVYALELNDQVRRGPSCRAMWSMALTTPRASVQQRFRRTGPGGTKDGGAAHASRGAILALSRAVHLHAPAHNQHARESPG